MFTFFSCDGNVLGFHGDVIIQVYDNTTEEEIVKRTAIASDHGCIIAKVPENAPIEAELTFEFSIDINGTTYTENLSKGQVLVINSIPAGKIYSVRCTAKFPSGAVYAAGTAEANVMAGKISKLDLVLRRVSEDSNPGPLPTNVTVTFNSNGGSPVDPQTFTRGGKATRPADPTKAETTFLGWFEDLTNESAFDFDTEIDSDKILYAKWEGYPVISFDSNGGTNVVSQTVEKGGHATLPDEPTREGYRFLGWYLNDTSSTEFNFSTPINGDITLHARWEKKPVVTFDANGGSFAGNSNTITQTVVKGECATPLNDNPEREGYTFLGWFANLTDTSAFDLKTPINADKTLYAKWEKKPVVTFNANGGSFAGNNNTITQTVEKGEYATQPETDPTKEGFTFLGWFESATGGTAFDFGTQINADKILYAGWEEKNVFLGTAYHELESADGTAGTGWTYVEFGDWPQTIKADNVEVDETKSVEVGMFTYYKGSDGAWYAKLSSKYYKVEPIKWRVLTDNYSGKRLLLAENVLVNCSYYDDSSDRGSVYSNNYMESRIRAYLNGISYNKKGSTSNEFVERGFLQTAFTESFRFSIAATNVDNSGDSTTDATGTVTKADGTNSSYPTDYTCGNTTDKVFLLSEKEVTTADYGFAVYNLTGVRNTRIRIPTDFAKASGARQDTGAYGGWWWLRSPCYSENYLARGVSGYAEANVHSDVSYSRGGVVPALCVNP